MKDYSPAEFARLSGVNYRTIVRWCAHSVDGKTTPMKAGVKREINGYYRIKGENLAHVRAYCDDREKSNGKW